MKKILLVEDNSDIVAIVSEMLREIGGSILFEAKTAGAAREVAEEYKDDIDLVFMTAHLTPHARHLNTEGLVRQVRTLCPNAIMVATTVDPQWAKKLIAAGCNECMNPVDMVNRDHLAKVIGIMQHAPA